MRNVETPPCTLPLTFLPAAFLAPDALCRAFPQRAARLVENKTSIPPNRATPSVLAASAAPQKARSQIASALSRVEHDDIGSKFDRPIYSHRCVRGTGSKLEDGIASQRRADRLPVVRTRLGEERARPLAVRPQERSCHLFGKSPRHQPSGSPKVLIGPARIGITNLCMCRLQQV